MIAPRTVFRSSRNQTGAAMLILLLILIMGSATLLLTKLNKGDPRRPRAVDTTVELGAIRAALIGYAQANAGCLPCPSQPAPGDGVAPSTCTTPAARAGDLPWVSLGIGAQDRWGRRYTYVVDPAFAEGCTFPPSGNLTAWTRNNSGPLTQIAIPNGLVAIVVSHGTNGYGAVDANGYAQANPPATHIDELSNRRNSLATSLSVIQRIPTDDTAGGGPFDDLVAWITRDDLNAQYNASLPPPPP